MWNQLGGILLTELIPTTRANVVDSVSHNHVFCIFFPLLKRLRREGFSRLFSLSDTSGYATEEGQACSVVSR